MHSEIMGNFAPIIRSQTLYPIELRVQTEGKTKQGKGRDCKREF